MSDTGVIYVVDDDEAVRRSLKRSLQKRGYTVLEYDSAESFLSELTEPHRRSCMLLDMRMPGMNGLELQQVISTRQLNLPIIFITGHGDIPMSVNAMKAGAVEFLEKPYSIDSLLQKINEAIELCVVRQAEFNEKYEISLRYERLTNREREVMTQLLSRGGSTTSKMVARQLGISHRTVDDHRARIMAKMQANSIAELMAMAKHCGISLIRST